MRSIGVAVIGLGGMGLHDIAVLKEVDFIKRLVGVDLNAQRCCVARERYGVEVTTDVSDVWRDRDVELVYITTPNNLHAPIAIDALRAGKKVMTEKPMGVTLAQTEELLSVVRETGGFLQVGFECRNYSLLYLRMKEIIDSGEIGKVRHINLTYILPPFGTATEAERWKFNKAVTGGIYPEKLCHYIDLPRWWVGKEVVRFFSVKADNTIPYYEIPDNSQCTYQFEDGTVSHLTFMMGPAHMGNPDLLQDIDIYDQKDQGYNLNYRIVGTEGALESALFHRELRVFHFPSKPGHNTNTEMVRVERWERKDDLKYFHNTPDQNIDIARRVACGEPPAISPEDAAETMMLCFEIEAAAETGEWRVIERNKDK